MNALVIIVAVLFIAWVAYDLRDGWFGDDDNPEK
jgi:hypothetical protein